MLRRQFLFRALALAALGLPVIADAQRPASGPTTIILVRHGEKAAEPANDPPLSPAGEARALALVDAVRSAGITAIYSTPWKRTQSTVAPIAAKLGIPVTTFDVRPGEKSYGELYAAELLAKHRGGTVLVAGHSNTVPGILTGLGITDAPTITDAEYDHLFVVTIPESGPPRVVRARYGAR
jgi:broad specificity phosphatase PhoE